jgi:hypothetical protein
LEVVFAPAFLRIIKKFDPHIKEGVKSSVADVIDYYETGQKTPGPGKAVSQQMQNPLPLGFLHFKVKTRNSKPIFDYGTA